MSDMMLLQAAESGTDLNMGQLIMLKYMDKIIDEDDTSEEV